MYIKSLELFVIEIIAIRKSKIPTMISSKVCLLLNDSYTLFLQPTSLKYMYLNQEVISIM